MLDTRKVVLTRFNTGRERGVNTGVSTVEQPLQLHVSMSSACFFLCLRYSLLLDTLLSGDADAPVKEELDE